MSDKLTPKQKRFVEEYMVDLNATQAAIRAGYSGHTARQIATENLAKPVIADAIAEAQDKTSERTHVTQAMVIAGLLREAQFDGEGASASARVTAWSHIAKHLGMFIERTENTNTTYLMSDQPMTLEEWADEYATEH